jgi:hypothetical protein
MHADLVVARLTPRTQQAYLRTMLQLIHTLQTAPGEAAVFTDERERIAICALAGRRRRERALNFSASRMG